MWSVDYIGETIQDCPMTMIIGETTSNDADYKTKVKELCQTILDDPEMKGVFDGIINLWKMMMLRSFSQKCSPQPSRCR